MIFELANAVLGGTEIALIMPTSEKIKFKNSVIQRVRSGPALQKFLKIFSEIDSKSSKASIHDDLINIRNFIKDQLGGFESVDQKVANALRLWIAGAMKIFCESFETQGTIEHAKFLIQSNLLFSAVGKFEIMLNFARQALEICEKVGNEWWIENAMVDVMIALVKLGRHSEAVEMNEQMLELVLKKYGPEHKDTAGAQYNLGVSYMKIQDWSKAELQLRNSWNLRKKLGSPMSHGVRLAQTKLAEVLRDSGKDVDEAARLFKEVLDYKSRVFGAQDATVLLTEVGHARCLEIKGFTVQALETYNKAFPICLKTWGENDPDVKKIDRWMEAAKKIEECKESQ